MESNYTLECESYFVDLERITCSAEALDWIIQISGKTWCTAEILAEFVWYLDELFNFQSTVCGQGIDKKMDPMEILNSLVQAN